MGAILKGTAAQINHLCRRGSHSKVRRILYWVFPQPRTIIQGFAPEPELTAHVRNARN